MTTSIEIASSNGLGLVVLEPAPHGANAFYYRKLPSGSDWVLDRRTEMKTPFEAAVELATAIVNAPPRIGRR